MNDSTPDRLGVLAGAERLLLRLIELSQAADAALDAEDLDTLLRAVESRDAAIRCDGPSLEALVALRRGLDGGHRRDPSLAEFDRRCAELDALATELQRSDARVEARLQESRRDLGAEIERSSIAAAAAAAYRGDGDARIDFRG